MQKRFLLDLTEPIVPKDPLTKGIMFLFEHATSKGYHTIGAQHKKY